MTSRPKTALLVIHGIGEQNPYETLDSFSRTLWDVLEPHLEKECLAGTHRVEQWQLPDGEVWLAHYLSLHGSQANEPVVDIHEHYWAHRLTDTITLGEVIEWLLRVSDGARTFYQENIELREKYEKRQPEAFTRDGRLKPRWYLRHVGWWLRILGFLRLIRLPSLPVVDSLIRALMKKATQKFVNYVGDVAVYTTTDMKSKHHEIREAILASSLKQVVLLLERYDRLIIAGHSLGSVIAFDTLNRVNREMNVGSIPKDRASRIEGLVTFGSPLDKIAFFFREHTPEEEYIRRQFLAHMHGFKSLDLTLQHNEREVRNTVQKFLEHVRWLNFWDPLDPISGHLDFYKIPDEDNVCLNLGEPWGLAHVGYWSHRPMYQRILQEFWKRP